MLNSVNFSNTSPHNSNNQDYELLASKNYFINENSKTNEVSEFSFQQKFDECKVEVKSIATKTYTKKKNTQLQKDKNTKAIRLIRQNLLKKTTECKPKLVKNKRKCNIKHTLSMPQDCLVSKIRSIYPLKYKTLKLKK